MSAKYVSSKFIRTVTKGGRALSAEYVDKTTAWTRPSGFPAATVKDEFCDLVEEVADEFSPETVKVAMKSVHLFMSSIVIAIVVVFSLTDRNLSSNRESEHQSPADMRKHYTAYAIDKDGRVIEAKHIVKKMKPADK